MECLEKVHLYMEELMQSILRNVFERFPALMEEVSDMSSRILNEHKNKANTVLESILNSEIGYVFTND